MSEKKNLMINCDVLDTRRMKEEDYAHYEQIVVNADLVLVSEASKSILAHLPLTLNHDKTVELPDDEPVELRTVNGVTELSGDAVMTGRTMLIANGVLRVRPGAEKALEQYVSIDVNGVVECPKSLEGYFARANVNGRIEAYPDDCVLLKRNFTLDEYFPLCAKADTHYYARQITFKNVSVDVSALAKKNVRFACKHFIVPEELVETAAPLFDEQAECTVVPRGMTLISDEVVLSEAFLRKHGAKLFIYGDASVDPDDRDGAIFARLEKLIVKGTLRVTKRQETALAELDAEYDELEITKGRCIENMAKARVDAALLGASPDGVKIVNAGTVVIAGDVTAEMILEKLALENVGTVECSEAQESAAAAVSENVGHIGASGEDDGADDSPAGALIDMVKNAAETKFVNADRYVM